jgi:PHS family inorganic phosphate transporter-like MFS transporter
LSATISSESSDHINRGANVAKVFAAQGWGQITAPILIVLLLSILPHSHASLQWTWRLALIFGSVPCILTFRQRWKLFRYELRHQTLPVVNSSGVKSVFRIIKENWKILLGTAGSWFILDVTFYANGLFAATLLALLGIDSNSTVYQKLTLIAEETVLMSLMALPGYYTAVYLIDKVGRRRLQQTGFLMMTFIFFLLGFGYRTISAHRVTFVLLYGLTFFFANMGPNTTTFVVPSEVFRPEVRATCHGISAASGKLGAVVGNALMAFILHGSSNGPAATLIFSGVVSLLGLLLSLSTLVPETCGRTLEEIYHS